MDKIALLQWHWQPDTPLVTGYSQNLAQATGLIGRGERKVVNLQIRDASHELQPGFLATSVKGVFRTAAAWLVERAAQEQRAATFVTCDYGKAVPERQRPVLGIRARESLCPVCQVFGGAGCLGDEVAPAQRRQGHVRFTFNQANNAWYGQSATAPGSLFAWETTSLNDVPFLSRLAVVLHNTIEYIENAEDLTIRPDILLENSDSHQVYRRLESRVASEQISSLRDWVRVLADDFPYLEIVELANELEEMANSSVDLQEERSGSLTAFRDAESKIGRWLKRLKDRPPKELVVEQLRSRSDVVLGAQVEPADDFAVALLLLAGDLVSSGFFRFGRFTSRGYGVVRLRPQAAFYGTLADVLDAEGDPCQPVAGDKVGYEVAQDLLKTDPYSRIRQVVREWMVEAG